MKKYIVVAAIIFLGVCVIGENSFGVKATEENTVEDVTSSEPKKSGFYIENEEALKQQKKRCKRKIM